MSKTNSNVNTNEAYDFQSAVISEYKIIDKNHNSTNIDDSANLRITDEKTKDTEFLYSSSQHFNEPAKESDTYKARFEKFMMRTSVRRQRVDSTKRINMNSLKRSYVMESDEFGSNS